MPRPCDPKSPQHGTIPKTRRSRTATARPDEADIPTSSKPPPAAVRKIPNYRPTPRPGTGRNCRTRGDEDDSATPSEPPRDTDPKSPQDGAIPKTRRRRTATARPDEADIPTSSKPPPAAVRKIPDYRPTPRPGTERGRWTRGDEDDSATTSEPPRDTAGTAPTRVVTPLPKRTYKTRTDDDDSQTSPRPQTVTRRHDHVTIPSAKTKEEYGTLEQKLRDRVDSMVVRHNSSSEAAKMIDVIRSAVLNHINTESPLRVTCFNCGSFYEKTKVADADEFDVLFCCHLPVTIIYDIPPRVPKYYCQLQLIPGSDVPAELLCRDRRTLSPKGFKGYFQSLVEEAIIQYKKGQGVARETRLRLGEIEVTQKDTSPAVTVTFRFGKISFDVVPAIEVMGWPSVCRPCPGKWLSEDDKRKCMAKVFVVPKHHSSEYMKTPQNCKLWRYGFNASEKQILLHGARQEIDGKHVCRKGVYKLLKQDVAGVVRRHDQEEMCTYFAKTVMFHVYEKFPKVADWITTPKNQTKLRLRYLNALEYFMNALREKNLSHYFIPGENLLDKACYSVAGDREMKILLDHLSERHDDFL